MSAPIPESDTVKPKHLLDVNVLLAAIWEDHPYYAKASAWLPGRTVLLCPISELGFLRISTHKVINAPMAKARHLLETFARERKAERIADDLPALESHPTRTEQVTDFYLANLADKHGARLATFDREIPHNAVDVID